MRVTQHDRHPTTEQLSAFLDGQLSLDERGVWDAHIKTCEQCQQELADLRLTVNLLRALPQPELPRSFALPVDAPVTPSAAYSAHPTSSAAQRRRSWPVALRTTGRSLCAIAAVLGLFLLASGLLADLPRATTTTSGSAASMPASQPQNSTSGSASTANENTPQAATTHRQTAATPEITPTAPSTMGPYAVKPGTPQKSDHMAAAAPANPFQPVLALFDVSTAGGRAALGALLLLLGAIGFILLLGRRPKERAP
jgi:hypothetical protein